MRQSHIITPCSYKLFRAKIIENDKCQLCGERQTLEHLFVECRHVHSFCLHSFCLLVELLPKVALTNNAKIYAHHPEKRSFFRAVNLGLIVARYYIYTAAEENESYSITAFKVLLKSKLSTESPSIRASVSF